jgi:hypothetical protein
MQGEYWSGTEDAQGPNVAWFFGTFYGGQGNITKDVQNGALAVRTGLARDTPPAVLLAALLKEVTGVAPEALADKVEQAQHHLQATCSVLTEFVNQVQDGDGKKIGSQLETKLIGDAQAIKAAIGCGSLPAH